MAMTGLAIAAALALAKDQLVDQPAAKRKRQLAATTERLSPWTGEHAGPVDDPNTIGSMMTAGASGAMIGQGITNSNAQNAYLASKSSGGAEGVAGLDKATPTMGAGLNFANPYGTTQDVGLSQPVLGSSAMKPGEPSWKFTGALNTSPEDEFARKLAMRDPYASLYGAGISPDAPSHYWNANPYGGN